MKKSILVAAAMMAFAFGPQAASADWYHSGVPLTVGENPSIQITGKFGYSEPYGSVQCPSATMTIQMTGATTDGHVTSFELEEPSKCHATGPVASTCGGPNSIKTMFLLTTPTVTIEGDTLEISNFDLITEYVAKCVVRIFPIPPSETVPTSPPLFAVPGNPQSIGGFTLSGTFASNILTPNKVVVVTGEMAVVGADNGTYGITP